MSVLAALWLALVHAFVLGAPVGGAGTDVSGLSPARWTAVVPGVGRAEPAADGVAAAQTESGTRAARDEARPGPDALRVAPTVTGAVALRGDVPRAPGPWFPWQGAAPRASAGAEGARAARARTLEGSHARAAHGAVRPYDSTAPPLQS